MAFESQLPQDCFLSAFTNCFKFSDVSSGTQIKRSAMEQLHIAAEMYQDISRHVLALRDLSCGSGTATAFCSSSRWICPSPTWNILELHPSIIFLHLTSTFLPSMSSLQWHATAKYHFCCHFRCSVCASRSKSGSRLRLLSRATSFGQCCLTNR